MHVGLISRGDFNYALDLANELSEVGTSVTLYLRHEFVVKAVGTSDQPVDRLY
jgi:hypothetical protein